MSKREGIMLCYPFEEKRLAKWKPPYIVQPKLDGERCRAYGYDPPEISLTIDWSLLSSEVNHIESVPHIIKALRKQITPVQTELDGELYIHGQSFDQIHSRVGRTVNIHPDYEEVGYYIFDIVTDKPQYERIGNLLDLSQKVEPPLFVVPFRVCYDLADVLEAYDEFIGLGYEGIVVRHWENRYIRRRSTYMMKFKPKKDDFYKIIGIKEEISIEGIPKGRLGALICTGGEEGGEFSVGSGLDDDTRASLWEERESLPGKIAHVKYQHITTGRKVPRFPVFIEIIEAEPEGVGLR